MKIICYMVVLLYLIYKVKSSKSPNVGTVLFTASDAIKKCWSDNDRSLLVARQIMQDLLPEPQSLCFNDPQFISVLIEYFQACFEIISRSTNGKNQHLMFLALADTIGGYLKSSILPITKKAYYAGNINYSEAKELFQLYDDIRSFLKTTGKGWAEPDTNSKCVLDVRPLKISKSGGNTACAVLFLPSEGNTFTNTDTDTDTYINTDTNTNTDTDTDIDTNTDTDTDNNFYHLPLPDFLTTTTCPPTTEECEIQSKFNEMGNIPEKAKSYSIEEIKRNFQKLMNSENRRLQFMEKYGGKLNRDVTFKDPFYRNQLSDQEKPDFRTYDRLVHKDVIRIKRNTNRDSSRKVESNYDSEKLAVDKPERSFKKILKKIGLKERSKSCENLRVPLPMLDNKNEPHSIAIPFKKNPLRSLDARSSIFILEKYYVTSVKCIASRSDSKKGVLDFNNKLRSWLRKEVFPHLSDEKWYPAFGGVLRIAESIKMYGTTCDAESHSQPMEKENFLFKEEHKVISMESDEESLSTRYFIMYIATAIMLVFLLIWLCCFLHWRPNKDCINDKKKKLNVQFIIRFFRKFTERCIPEEHLKGNRESAVLLKESKVGSASHKPSVQSTSKSKNKYSKDGKNTIVMPVKTIWEKADGKLKDSEKEAKRCSVLPIESHSLPVEWNHADLQTPFDSDSSSQGLLQDYYENSEEDRSYEKAFPVSVMSNYGTSQSRQERDFSSTARELYECIVNSQNTLNQPQEQVFLESDDSSSSSERCTSSSGSECTSFEPDPQLSNTSKLSPNPSLKEKSDAPKS